MRVWRLPRPTQRLSRDCGTCRSNLPHGLPDDTASPCQSTLSALCQLKLSHIACKQSWAMEPRTVRGQIRPFYNSDSKLETKRPPNREKRLLPQQCQYQRRGTRPVRTKKRFRKKMTFANTDRRKAALLFTAIVSCVSTLASTEEDFQ
jgi:hypothetical protein